MSKKPGIPTDADDLDLIDDEDELQGALRYHCVECKKVTTKPQYGAPGPDWLVRCPQCYFKVAGVLTMEYIPRRPPDKRTRAEQAAESIKAHLKPVEGDRRQISWDEHLNSTPQSYAAFLKAYYKKNAQYAPDSAITRNVEPHDHWWPK